MYIEVLSRASEGWDADDLDDGALLDHATACRAAVPLLHYGTGAWGEASLAAEVAYDRALITLASRHGIAVGLTDFKHPRVAREHLELELARRGVVVAASVEDSSRIASDRAGGGGAYP